MRGILAIAAILLLPGVAAEGAQWNLDVIRASGVPDGVDGAGIIVAVIDSGVDRTHPDLVGKMWHNEAEIADNGLDDDLNGYVDDANGWDFCNEAPNRATPAFFHGTAVASVIAADGEVKGLAPGVQIMDLQVICDDNDYDDREGMPLTSIDDLRAAIKYATDHGADVINLSLQVWQDQGRGLVPSLLGEGDEFAAARDADVLIVAASGNLGGNSPSSPGDNPHVFAVGATRVCDWVDRNSNGGVTLLAPGTAYAALSGGGHDYVHGTSFAAPLVAATAALLLQQEPSLSPGDVIKRISAAGVAHDGGAPRLDLGNLYDLPYEPVSYEFAYNGPRRVSSMADITVVAETSPPPTFVQLDLPGDRFCFASHVAETEGIWVNLNKIGSPADVGVRFGDGRTFTEWHRFTLIHDPDAERREAQFLSIGDVDHDAPGVTLVALAGALAAAAFVAARRP